MNSRINSFVQVAVFVLLALLGPALLAWGVVAGDEAERLVREGTRVDGTVTELVDRNRSTYEFVDVEFVAADGQTYTARAISHEDESPEVGSSLPVAYDEEDPERNTVVGYEDDANPLGGAGTILTLLIYGGALLFFVKSLRRRRRRHRSA